MLVRFPFLLYFRQFLTILIVSHSFFMIKEYRFSFESLRITPHDLTPLLGFPGGVIPEPFPELIDQAIKWAPRFCDIRGGYRIFNEVIINCTTNSIEVGEQIFHPSKIVTAQLKNACSCAIFVCTAGTGFTDLAREKESGGDFPLAYILDVLGSVTVEKAMDKLQDKLLAEVRSQGMKISDRYSPGYCDWDTAEQQKLFALLPPAFCGIALSSSSMMSPIKSVSGIIGIGKTMETKGYQCHWCSDVNCLYGKIRRQKKY